MLEAGGWRLDVGSWMVEAGSWRLDVGGTLCVLFGCWMLDAGGWKLEGGDWRKHRCGPSSIHLLCFHF